MKTIYKCFRDGHFRALTMSYDDGRSQDRRLVEIFNRHGIKGSFHLNAGLMQNDPRGRIKHEEARELYAGHEISAHTYTHPTIARCPLSLVAQEILEDRKALEDIAGYTVRGLSYPNGSYSQMIIDMLPALGIEYARVVGDTHSFSIPEDFYTWTSTCHHNHNLIENAERFMALGKRQYLCMMYVWGHSYEFDNDNNWELIERFCELTGGSDDVWYATNIEIVDYLKAWDCLKFAANGSFVYNPTASDLWLSAAGKIVRIPAGTQVSLI